MTFIKSGDVYRVSDGITSMVDTLPVGTYFVTEDERGNINISKTDNMAMPNKMYGDLDKKAERIVNTFLDRADTDKNTGVLLSGAKGSGKTQLAKVLSFKLREKGISTFLIQGAPCGDNFMVTMKTLSQKAMVLFDEFEKHYTHEGHQNTLLSLLDGTHSTSKLFVMTTNSHGVSQFLLNRPARIFYHYKYGKIDKGVMLDMIKELLHDKKHTGSFEMLWDMSSEISFDVVNGIIEELNRYPEDAFADVIKQMNVVAFSERNLYDLECTVRYDSKIIPTCKNRLYDINTINFISGNEDESIKLEGHPVVNPKDFVALRLTNDDNEQYTAEMKNSDTSVWLYITGEPSDTKLENGSIVLRRVVNGKPLEVTFVPRTYFNMNSLFSK